MRQSKPIKVNPGEVIKFHSMPKTLEQLKQVIQAANPEIMELKFGCAVISKKGTEGIVLVAPDSIDVRITVTKIGYEGTITHLFIKDLTIIGRPIRLADVLLAIFKRDTGKNSEGFIYKVSPDCENIILQWNLKNDNLDHQSEKTKQFLIDLLVP